MSPAFPDPGAFDHRLVLEAPVEVPDGAGGVIRTYAAAATLWAAVETVAVHGGAEGGAPGQTATHRVLLRYRPDVTTRHRLRDGARVFAIVALRERGRRRFLEIEAEERRA